MVDDKVRVLQIGPAGEKGVRFANIVNDLKHFNGRGGLGAVMGAKNLRAIAVRGTAKPDFADPAKLVALARAGAEKVARDGTWKNFKALGTLQTVTDNQLIGGLPTRNWTMGTFERYEEIGAEAFAETMMDKPGTCFACAQSCRRDTKEGIEKPWRIEARYGGPDMRQPAWWARTAWSATSPRSSRRTRSPACMAWTRSAWAAWSAL